MLVSPAHVAGSLLSIASPGVHSPGCGGLSWGVHRLRGRSRDGRGQRWKVRRRRRVRVFDDIQFDRRPYDQWAAYGQSKTANVLFAVEATSRWAGDGIVANALMPGGIATNLQKHIPQSVKDGYARMAEAGEIFMKSTQQGAATTLIAAIAPEFARTGGHYLEDGNEVPVVANDAEVPPIGGGVRQWAVDPEAATRLWTTSVALLGQPTLPCVTTTARMTAPFTQEAWDARYRAADLVWSGNPNPHLVEHVTDLAPGSALDVGSGEGADVIWLAARGWQVTGVGVSTVALDRRSRWSAPPAGGRDR